MKVIGVGVAVVFAILFGVFAMGVCVGAVLF
jgi:hypothetical protein